MFFDSRTDVSFCLNENISLIIIKRFSNTADFIIAAVGYSKF